MGNKWEDNGLAGWEHLDNEITSHILPSSWQTHIHNVENTDTGEERRVRVDPGQSVGEAIENGQWDD